MYYSAAVATSEFCDSLRLTQKFLRRAIRAGHPAKVKKLLEQLRARTESAIGDCSGERAKCVSWAAMRPPPLIVS